MKPRSSNQFLLFLGLFSAVLGSIPAEGFSLCVGPDTHVTLEVSDASCCLWDEPTTVLSLGRPTQDCGGCQDTPLNDGIGLVTHHASLKVAGTPQLEAPLPSFMVSREMVEFSILAHHARRPPGTRPSRFILRC